MMDDNESAFARETLHTLTQAHNEHNHPGHLPCTYVYTGTAPSPTATPHVSIANMRAAWREGREAALQRPLVNPARRGPKMSGTTWSPSYC